MKILVMIRCACILSKLYTFCWVCPEFNTKRGVSRSFLHFLQNFSVCGTLVDTRTRAHVVLCKLVHDKNLRNKNMINVNTVGMHIYSICNV